MRRAASLFVLLSAAALHAQPPPPPPPPPPLHDASQTRSLTGAGTIRGRVVADNGDEPLRKARVVIGGPTSIPPAFTDDQGRFAFTKLPAGQYALTVRKAGYAAAAFGSRHPGEPPMRIDLAAGGTVDGIDVRMMRGAAISGRLVDEFGEPIENAAVFAERVVRVAGRTSTTSQASTLSDDLGEYRLGGLPSGTYVVVARVTKPPIITATAGGTVVFGGMNMARSRTYYPGVVALAEAQRIDVQAGEERSAVDFGVLAARALARLTLSFVDAKGNPTDAIPTLSSGDDTAGGVTIGLPSIGPRISTRIEPGAWTVYATGAAGVGIGSVTVGSDDVAMTMALTRGGRISGRVVADGGHLPAGAVVEIEALPSSVSMQPFLARGSIARTGSDGTFELKDLLGVRELRVRSAPAGWLTKAIIYNGRNLLDTNINFKGGEDLAGVQVFLTDRHAELSGIVVDARQVPLQRYSVVVFPEDEQLLRDPRRLARLARPNQAGQFRIEDLLPGTYCVVAVSDVDSSQWLNADYLARFRPVATRIAVAESEKKNVVLPLVDTP